MAHKGAEELGRFLSENGSPAQLLGFSGSVHSVEGAARELGTDPNAAIKTLIFVSEDKRIVAAIVEGIAKGDRRKIEAVAGIGKLHFASPEEALQYTGYAVGGTPPVDNSASITIIDPAVMARTVDSYGERRRPAPAEDFL